MSNEGSHEQWPEGVSTATFNEVEGYTPNDADFQKAIRACGPLALQRLWRKMSKVKWRAARWEGEVNMVMSPLNPGSLMAVLNTNKPHGITRQRLMPSNLDAYVTNFILMYKDKEPVR